MKCNQSRPGCELVSPCPFATTITITPQAPPITIIYTIYKHIVFYIFYHSSTHAILYIYTVDKPIDFYVFLLHSLERAAAGIGLHVNAHKTEYMCFNQTGDISTLDGRSLKLVNKFTYLGSSVSSTKKDIDMLLTKAWTAIDRLSIIWKSDLTDKMKRSFFQAAVVSILLYGCTTWTLTKRLEKKLDGNYTRMLRAILNKSWWQHPTKHQLYGHLPPIT